VWVTINSRGLRDREIPYEKDPQVRRILMLGDSTTAAMQVPLEETFVKQLEAHLIGAGEGEWEVVNAGVNAYGTDNELIFYEWEGSKYDPDIVFLDVYLANDIYNNSRTLELRLGGQSHKPYFELNESGELELRNFPVAEAQTLGTKVGSFLKKHFQLPRFVAQVLGLRRSIPDWIAPVVRLFGGSHGIPAVDSKGGRAKGKTLQIAQRKPDICDPDYLPIVEAAWDITNRIISKLKTEVEAGDREFAVLLIPAAPQIIPPAEGQDWYCDRPNEELTAFLEAEGIPYLDMLTAFREASLAGDGPFYFERDLHMNEAGHKLAGELLFDFVTKTFVAECEN
jgi:lysophospholipase L1-like esterase